MNQYSPEVTARKKALFVEAMAARPNVGAAAKVAGIPRKTAYQWRENDPEFAEAWDEAKEATLDRAEEKLVDIGQEGNVVALFGYLKAYREQFREKSQVSVDLTGPIRVEFGSVLDADAAARLAAKNG
jgi:hypothetical protein